jgi:hypothetical protein
VLTNLLGSIDTHDDHSDSESLCIIVAEGDYITLPGSRVYIALEITRERTVRCVSPSNPVNEPITVTLEEANKSLLRQCM